MGNKLLVFLTILVSVFIGLCVAIIVMVQNPELNKNLSNFFKNETEEETFINPSLEESQTEESKESLIISKEPMLTTEIKEYISHKGRVSIEFPEISGMTDLALQERINKKIYDNAISIVPLYPVSTALQKISIKTNVDFLDENKINILYTGTLIGTAIVSDNYNASSQNQGTNTNTGDGSLSDNPSNNYQTGTSGQNNTGSIPQNNVGLIPNNTIPSQNGNNINGTMRPGETAARTNGSKAPGLDNQNTEPFIFGYTKSISINQKIFYTNCIDLNTGLDMSLKNFVDTKTLAKYARSSKAEYVNIDEKDKSAVRKYIQLSTVSSLTEVFNNADFKNNSMKTWPKSFSYIKDGFIYFSIKLSTKLGNYAIIKYRLN